MITLDLRILNTYEDGDEYTTVKCGVEVPPPPVEEYSDAYTDWADEHIFPHTGTGRTKGDSWYDVTVTASSAPHLIPVGTTYEFGY